MNAVIACGGTGGHLFPGLAVAEVLQARGHEVLLFISEKEVDTLAVEGRTEFRYEKLPTVALPSPFSPAILAFVRRFNDSLSLCRAIFRKFQPHVVLGMGGFTSTAPVLAGRMRGVATFIHESNAIPGKANRHTARFVRAVLLGFKECAEFFPKAHTEFTGTPIRSSLRRIDRNEALEKFGLVPGIPTLLVMGGSQGASGINQALIKAMPSLQGLSLQVIHLSGSRDARLLEDNYRRENIPARVVAFQHQMEEVYSAADLVIARAGASSLAEFSSLRPARPPRALSLCGGRSPDAQCRDFREGKSRCDGERIGFVRRSSCDKDSRPFERSRRASHHVGQRCGARPQKRGRFDR